MKKRVLAVVLAVVLALAVGTGTVYKLSEGSHRSATKPQRASLLPTPPVRRNAVAPPHSFAVAHPNGPVALHARPFGKIVATVEATSDFGQPRALAVVARRPGWYAVLDPAVYNRPGWVQAQKVHLSYIRTEIVVSLARHRLSLLVGGKVLRTMTVGVGAPQTPTPLGRFAVVDRFPSQRFSSAYGCCILGLSGHQPRLSPGWPGGDRLAIHGTNAPWTIGRNASNGCLHASAGDMRYLEAHVPFGTQVLIGP